MSSYQHLSVVQLQQMMAEDAELQIVDIRDPASFETAHIPGAIRLGNDNLADYLRDADMDKPLVVCCYHGISSQSAAEYLQHQGFDEVYSLDGGFAAWPRD
ncbi:MULTISPECIES: thiosulfate sulfurtransferase GlpE [Shewanella]|jgi:thiosulfate sulfurtransferase|uniref:Thiosulfate sulfurtransferase GlpE n=1 Tax=Shewanella indica TaxID=768528 RepID=A0ABU4QBT5_9GAMM|nr:MULTISPECIES: thiosulfate sulfurtransferase GlpE [Shewanella]MCE9774822.1 thiosulfate sulfurtransferase GlpE [Shewanella algae]MCE9792864.1 thiosulfate sulfurtransferase GlpE [Shewanella indica]MCL1160983.1 thiosulfate sulfurtransferase GlpE [Shewanella chilikensis]MDX6015995.1 thiosulfate sulfurtransferase GlpE [Shewanella indica]NDO74900.1 thiosulfate sulfurtransferase GlpE [Shewanella sp. SE1]